MRDSTRAGLIPPSTPVVAGYADGLYAWSAADWALFPNAVKLSIAVHPEHAGDILDVERGDATPEDIPGWADRFSRPPRRAPTVYCSRSAWLECQKAAGLRRIDWWISTLDGTTSVVGAVAVQFADFGGFDESVILEPSWVGMGADQNGGDLVLYLLPGPAANPADQLARRIKVHEWGHLRSKVVNAETEMDQLLAVWVAQGAEAVLAQMMGA
jgi:hypothetical protein